MTFAPPPPADPSLPPVRARDLLGPQGPLARSLSGYEDRPGQLTMADAVEHALETERVLVCEAGTGTGKTLAYLVPAIRSGKKVVVSTATKALQEQIFTRDLPLLERELGLDAQAVVVKGLSNYLCLRRYHEFRGSPEALGAHYARSLGILEKFRESSRTGDFADIPELGEDNPILQEVRSSSETRIGPRCAHFNECFVTQMKRSAERARLLIVNHHLFFADLALRGPHSGGALPPYDAVIFDEAHQLEDVATSFFGVRVSTARIDAMLRDAERAFVDAGLIERLSRRGEGASLILATRDATHALFTELAVRYPRAEGRASLDREAWKGELIARYHKLDAALDALGNFATTQERGEAIELVSRRARELRDDLATVVEGAKNQVTWVEVRARSAAIGASPVDLSDMVRSRVFEQVPAVVLTSATLATSRGFSFLRSRLGINGDRIVVDELEVPSPFDYATHALVYVPSDLPDPRDADWLDRAGARITLLIEMTGGGAFVLCTSNRVMRALHGHLAAHFAAQGKRATGPLLLQGEASKTSLLAKFRESGSAVLVATMSFWEGVDVPGHALRLVILDKIPFAVPTDPIVVARSAALEQAGESPFARYHVPAAAIALKQGFGRLIRTQDDAGIVAILDGRIHAKGYGKILLKSLPPAQRTESLEVTRQFAAGLPRPRGTTLALPLL